LPGFFSRILLIVLLSPFFSNASALDCADNINGVVEKMKLNFQRKNIIRSSEKLYDYFKAEKIEDDYEIFRLVSERYKNGKKSVMRIIP
jgi:UPF0716 family protein affecting phage T7 exclusion